MALSPEKIRADFEKAYDTHFEPIFLFLAARLNDRERAKELAQETFMRTWTHLANGNTIYLMRPFLYTTAYNLFKNELRRMRDVASLEELFEQRGFEVRDTALDAETRSVFREALTEIEKLSVREQEALRLRYVEGLPIKEIAAQSGETPTAIAVRIHRALKQLQKTYGKIHS